MTKSVNGFYGIISYVHYKGLFGAHPIDLVNCHGIIIRSLELGVGEFSRNSDSGTMTDYELVILSGLFIKLVVSLLATDMPVY